MPYARSSLMDMLAHMIGVPHHQFTSLWFAVSYTVEQTACAVPVARNSAIPIGNSMRMIGVIVPVRLIAARASLDAGRAYGERAGVR